MQLLAFFLVYLLGGVGCALFALLRCKRRHALDLVSMVLLWPLCAPFLFAASAQAREPHHSSSPPKVDMRVLAKHCDDLQSRLSEIDALLCQEGWDRERVASKREGLALEGAALAPARESLALRLEHIDRLQFLRKVHATELEQTQGLLDQLQSQEQLSRFLAPREGEDSLRFEVIRQRIADSERVLASETELIALCHESL